MDQTVKTALLMIAMGKRYRRYANQNILSAEKFFVEHDTIVFTDDPDDFTADATYFHRANLGFPRATLMRYHIFLSISDQLAQYDQLFYSDADMLFVAPVTGDEIFSDGI